MEKVMNESKRSKKPFTVVDIQLEEKNLVISLEDQKGRLIKKVDFFIFQSELLYHYEEKQTDEEMGKKV